MAVLIKYWRPIAAALIVFALFAYHKYECGKSYYLGRESMAAEVSRETEKARQEAQKAIDKAEAEALSALELREVEIRVVDREVVKTVIPECPDSSVAYIRLRNQYARAVSGNHGAGVDTNPVRKPERE